MGRILDGSIEIAISIKNEDVERAARELASRMGVDITRAIGTALRHELARTDRRREARLSGMRSIADRIAEMPIRDARSDDEILGYDELGLPR